MHVNMWTLLPSIKGMCPDRVLMIRHGLMIRYAIKGYLELGEGEQDQLDLAYVPIDPKRNRPLRSDPQVKRYVPAPHGAFVSTIPCSC
jgi:hypothetical protein